MMDSEIIHHRGGTTLTGPDAMRYFHALQLKGALSLWQKGIKVTRGATLKRLLDMVSSYTHKEYTRKQIDQAIADIDVWAKEMRAALPESDER